MAAVLLVTVYEYSPLFYIGVVSLCFVVTAAMVLGWFGFDVPVILRASDETESVSPTPERPMVQVTNPFSLELGSGPACITESPHEHHVCCTLIKSTENTQKHQCGSSWMESRQAAEGLKGALQDHQQGTRLSSRQLFREALHHRYRYCQTFLLGKDSEEEHLTRIPPKQGVTGFGPLPRQCYPLVAVLTLKEDEAAHVYSIVASVTVIHVPDSTYTMSARVLFQYLLTSQGNMYELKPLFMSAEGSGMSGATDVQRGSHPGEPNRETLGVGANAVQQEEEEQEEDDDDEHSVDVSRGCVVCQNAAVNRVLLPCRHACVCDSCVSHFQHCPICRAFILESFTLTQATLHDIDSAVSHNL